MADVAVLSPNDLIHPWEIHTILSPTGLINICNILEIITSDLKIRIISIMMKC